MKHEFAEIWSDYTRCLKQRNALLRHGKLDMQALRLWTMRLAQLGEHLNSVRDECLQRLLPVLREKLEAFDFFEGHRVQVEILPGWSAESSTLEEELEGSLERDRKLGYTSLGPHKCDLRLTVDRRALHEMLSRGQQKSVVSAMYSALITTFTRESGQKCVILVDDLPAELDPSNRSHLVRWLCDLDMQIFVTGIYYDQLREFWPAQRLNRAKMFHVKQGQITEYPHSNGEQNDR